MVQSSLTSQLCVFSVPKFSNKKKAKAKPKFAKKRNNIRYAQPMRVHPVVATGTIMNAPTQYMFKPNRHKEFGPGITVSGRTQYCYITGLSTVMYLTRAGVSLAAYLSMRPRNLSMEDSQITLDSYAYTNFIIRKLRFDYAPMINAANSESNRTLTLAYGTDGNRVEAGSSPQANQLPYAVTGPIWQPMSLDVSPVPSPERTYYNDAVETDDYRKVTQGNFYAFRPDATNIDAPGIDFGVVYATFEVEFYGRHIPALPTALDKVFARDDACRASGQGKPTFTVEETATLKHAQVRAAAALVAEDLHLPRMTYVSGDNNSTVKVNTVGTDRLQVNVQGSVYTQSLNTAVSNPVAVKLVSADPAHPDDPTYDGFNSPDRPEFALASTTVMNTSSNPVPTHEVIESDKPVIVNRSDCKPAAKPARH